ncbi:hypothetical protein Pmani_010502 [Petrolisthes manimaculis]|uniref:Uncharacterized protein n=1 Tax=Petrolisthes manimaculis TaxID=1843537 RepID=A0AAE1UCK7_9EUCA|nr:hypothetical protein Pmani_010502 [Petrolisthes manimaculis]
MNTCQSTCHEGTFLKGYYTGNTSQRTLHRTLHREHFTGHFTGNTSQGTLHKGHFTENTSLETLHREHFIKDTSQGTLHRGHIITIKVTSSLREGQTTVTTASFRHEQTTEDAKGEETDGHEDPTAGELITKDAGLREARNNYVHLSWVGWSLHGGFVVSTLSVGAPGTRHVLVVGWRCMGVEARLEEEL